MARVRAVDGNLAQTTSTSMVEPKPIPKQRKKSKYNRELSRQLRKVKQMHPRTLQSNLMAKAHKLTRKALGMPPKRRAKK